MATEDRKRSADEMESPAKLLEIMTEDAAARVGKSCNVHIGSGEVPSDFKQNPEDKFSIGCGSFSGVALNTMAFINADDDPSKPLSISFQFTAFDEIGKAWIKTVAPHFSFDPESPFAQEFAAKCSANKYNKTYKGITAEIKTKGLAGEERTKFILEKLHADNLSPKPAFTKQVIVREIGDDGEEEWTLKVSWNASTNTPPSRGRSTFSEHELDNMPIMLANKIRQIDAAGGAIKGSPFRTIEGKQIPLGEIFTNCTTSPKGSIYLKLVSRPKFSGAKLAWTGGSSGENFSRVLTIPFLGSVQVVAAIRRQSDGDDEATDAELVMAYKLAKAEAGDA